MIQPLAWREHFSVGHRGLDDEHRSMVETINAICESEGADGGAPDIRARCESLKELSTKHFEHEEAVLEAIQSFAKSEPGFPASIGGMSKAMFAEHFQDHRHAIDELGALIARAGSAGTPVCEELSKWFVAHAVKYDSHLKAVFQAMQNDCPALFRRLL